ncbi:hypothetical protein EMIHUDRAFT_113243 [Emiliania huxleyi CCMP1516]|uniref:Uncharacterized protein n=2 Tax=Emiliania huxleyi TaxID=2903 RepID=A0A0D3K3X0_EMIH1|nr:hypothetical protein EMIHUDRAFT_113243 [Emiliania huxleyi CCMP1516]EOD30455.1 hypothetical protein EMIHUDRAFT_113243 [Emiliania huxleyi CCMP1516]|eukprot:XP_005782884.1 hypothetical protein EMIHUDRAFT_113243 [Emiliania huxleyi CCMP1516]
MEWECEEAATNQRLLEWPVEKLEKEGLCLAGLSARRRKGRFYSQPILRLSLRRSGLKHSFQPGDEALSHGCRKSLGSVLLSRGCPLQGGAASLKGEVLELHVGHIDVALSAAAASPPDGVERETWRLDRVANRTACARALGASPSGRSGSPLPAARLAVALTPHFQRSHFSFEVPVEMVHWLSDGDPRRRRSDCGDLPRSTFYGQCRWDEAVKREGRAAARAGSLDRQTAALLDLEPLPLDGLLGRRDPESARMRRSLGCPDLVALVEDAAEEEPSAEVW